MTLSVGPTRTSNYASCVRCCISHEGALLSEFAPCSLHLEHVKLSAQRSRWPIGPALPVVSSRTPVYLSAHVTAFIPLLVLSFSVWGSLTFLAIIYDVFGLLNFSFTLFPASSPSAIKGHFTQITVRDFSSYPERFLAMQIVSVSHPVACLWDEQNCRQFLQKLNIVPFMKI